MTKNNLRIAIIVLGLWTAGVHLYLNIRPGYGWDYPFLGAFLLNGLGYLALLGAMFLDIPALDRVRKYIPWALMLFALVTIVSFLKFGDPSDTLGWVTKGDEVLLIIATFLYQRQAA